jgi:hypothetical protein
VFVFLLFLLLQKNVKKTVFDKAWLGLWKRLLDGLLTTSVPPVTPLLLLLLRTCYLLYIYNII